MKEDIINIVKIGGNIINDTEKLKNFLKRFSTLPGKKILVHGGGKEATEISKKLGIETIMREGRRITDRATLDVVTMVYAGLLNKRIVSILDDESCKAIGLTGADAEVIPARRRDPKPIDYGYVGDIETSKINTSFIFSLLDQQIVPVFCAICYEKGGSLLNCNADSVASAIAEACSQSTEVRLTYCFEKPGVMADVENPDSLIPLVTQESFKELIASGAISGGMIPKVTNALKATDAGVKEVRICDAENLTNQIGTIIRK